MNFTIQQTKTSFLKLAAIFAVVFTSLNLQAQNILPGKLHFGLVYPLSTNGSHAALDTNNLSLNLIAGLSAAERGCAFAGISNVVLKDVKGTLFAGFSNHVGKTVDGALFAGFINTYGGGKGPAFAGFSNVSASPLKGAQFAGFSNFAKKIEGVQVAGFINTAKSVKGSQFAGFINIAKKVTCVQAAGFINIADSSDYPIGIINIVKNGKKGIAFTIDENQTLMSTFRSGGRILYGIIGAGYNLKNTKEVYAFEAGLGAHFLDSRLFSLNLELTSSVLESFKQGDYFKSSLRLMPAIKLGKSIEIFGGPSINFINTNTSSESLTLQKHYFKRWDNRWGNDVNALYIGYATGIQFNF